ncbi:UNKNOWN [Stylonychia lemnae]|uniref:Uncharacterized protein n=1 Tax=Stylonychia lemnae TaxID=5949 RepID=A0A078AH28_STYLE|nr:UNKNOWN [Stylonychia lemnae]|eukprot:CDW81580.1 UNKNOWN [Stylonychia lemnae]
MQKTFETINLSPNNNNNDLEQILRTQQQNQTPIFNPKSYPKFYSCVNVNGAPSTANGKKFYVNRETILPSYKDIELSLSPRSINLATKRVQKEKNFRAISPHMIKTFLRMRQQKLDSDLLSENQLHMQTQSAGSTQDNQAMHQLRLNSVSSCSKQSNDKSNRASESKQFRQVYLNQKLQEVMPLDDENQVRLKNNLTSKLMIKKASSTLLFKQKRFSDPQQTTNFKLQDMNQDHGLRLTINPQPIYPSFVRSHLNSSQASWNNNKQVNNNINHNNHGPSKTPRVTSQVFVSPGKKFLGLNDYHQHQFQSTRQPSQVNFNEESTDNEQYKYETIINKKQLNKIDKKQKTLQLGNVLQYGLPTTADYEYQHLQLSPKPTKKQKQQQQKYKIKQAPLTQIKNQQNIVKPYNHTHQMKDSDMMRRRLMFKSSYAHGYLSSRKNSQRSTSSQRRQQENQERRKLLNNYLSQYDFIDNSPLKIQAQALFQNQYVKNILFQNGENEQVGVQ